MRRSVLVTLVVCLFASLLIAGRPGGGHIEGVVRDVSGAALSAVTVTITSMDATRFSRSTATDVSGRYQFRDLPAGSYKLEARHDGFNLLRLDVVVTEQTTLNRPLVMSAGNLTRSAREAASPTPSRDDEHAIAAASPQGQQIVGGVIGGVSGGVVGGIAGSGSGIGIGLAALSARARDFNTETYDKIDDSRWTHVANHPLSTFSTDVDTAAYANVRRFINQGQMPPKDAVRIEELVNYFSYDYPEPKGDTPFSVTTGLGDCPWNSEHKLAFIGLQARHLDRAKTPPRNLVFLIDVSGSMMTPNKLPLVKASLAMLARNLTDRDRIAIVVYAGAAGLVLPSTSGSDTSTIIGALGSLNAGGSTNGAQGLRLAYNVAREHFITGGVNRVVLATDGDFNVGVTNQGDLIRLIEQQREGGITLSVLGFGMGNLKDSTMEKLADRGDGNYSYIDSLSEAQKVLVEEAGGTLVTLAKDVKLQIEFNPKVIAAYRLIGYENRRLEDRDFNDDTKDAGDMGAGHSVTALYELELAGPKASAPGVDPLKYQQTAALSSQASRAEAMTVKVRYKKPDADTSTLLSTAVSTANVESPTLGFASAVAEFGMLLRDSAFKGTASYTHVSAMASRYQGDDRHGHRAEFRRLVVAAQTLSGMTQGTQP